MDNSQNDQNSGDDVQKYNFSEGNVGGGDKQVESSERAVESVGEAVGAQEGNGNVVESAGGVVATQKEDVGEAVGAQEMGGAGLVVEEEKANVLSVGEEEGNNKDDEVHGEGAGIQIPVPDSNVNNEENDSVADSDLKIDEKAPLWIWIVILIVALIGIGFGAAYFLGVFNDGGEGTTVVIEYDSSEDVEVQDEGDSGSKDVVDESDDMEVKNDGDVKNDSGVDGDDVKKDINIDADADAVVPHKVKRVVETSDDKKAKLNVFSLVPQMIGSPDRARDAGVKADLSHIVTVLESYANDHDGEYPQVSVVSDVPAVLGDYFKGGEVPEGDYKYCSFADDSNPGGYSYIVFGNVKFAGNGEHYFGPADATEHFTEMPSGDCSAIVPSDIGGGFKSRIYYIAG